MVEIKGEEHAKMVQLALEYDPGPPFDSGAPEEPSANTIARVHPRIRRLAGDPDTRFRAVSEKLAAAA
jgi:cyclohexyl-isocyanide hydratase